MDTIFQGLHATFGADRPYTSLTKQCCRGCVPARKTLISIFFPFLLFQPAVPLATPFKRPADESAGRSLSSCTVTQFRARVSGRLQQSAGFRPVSVAQPHGGTPPHVRHATSWLGAWDRPGYIPAAARLTGGAPAWSTTPPGNERTSKESRRYEIFPSPTALSS